MEGEGIMRDDTSEAFRLQQMWEAQQRLQLLGPAASRNESRDVASRNATGQWQPLQELVPTLEQHRQPGASIASGVNWMRRVVAGDRTSVTPDRDGSLLPHAPQRQRLHTL